MIKLIKNNYLFLILFLLFLIKDGIYNLINIELLESDASCNILVDDYNKLLEFSNIDYAYNANYLNTYILYKDIYDYLEVITINGGKNYNLDSNAVIYNNTLLGIISNVHNSTSEVKLLTNKDTKIAVKINEEIGVLIYDGNKLIVKNISNYSNIEIGDEIYTSGLGNIKENIYIGKVANINLDTKEIEKYIEVYYELNIKEIDYVTVYGVDV